MSETEEEIRIRIVAEAVQKKERTATIAYLLDRVVQYAPRSGYHAFVSELVAGIAGNDHVERFDAGEYDDLAVRVERIMKR